MFEEREQKVHLHKNNRNKRNRRGGPVDDTLCMSNHGNSGIKTTEDVANVTCKRCLNRMYGRMAKTPISAGSKEHIDIVRAPLLAQIQELQKQVHDAVEVRIGRERENEEHAKTIRGLLSDNKALKDENNDLRRLLHDSELDRERMRGYMDAVEDARPPRMVEEQRERRFGRYTGTPEVGSWANPSGSGYGGSKPRPWYERP